jgi:hypothetical protein
MSFDQPNKDREKPGCVMGKLYVAPEVANLGKPTLEELAKATFIGYTGTDGREFRRELLARRAFRNACMEEHKKRSIEIIRSTF